MLQSIHDQMTDFYDSIEEEYATFFGDHFDWEHVHFKFLIYYLVRYGIGCRRDFIVYHYRVAYRLYLEKLIMNQRFISCWDVFSKFPNKFTFLWKDNNK